VDNGDYKYGGLVSRLNHHKALNQFYSYDKQISYRLLCEGVDPDSSIASGFSPSHKKIITVN